MTTPSTPPAEGRSRWFNAALIASLALNLLFIGGLAKAYWHHRHGPFGGPGMMSFARDFDPERRKTLREDFKAARETVRPLRQAVRGAWSEANTLLAAETFDKEKYRAAMDRVTEAEGRVRAAMAAAMAETASKMTAEERSKLQAWREQRMLHKFDRRHGPEGAGD
jgi:uncharacterized membrane protein